MTEEIKTTTVKEVWADRSDYIKWLKESHNLKLIGEELGFSLEITEYDFPKEKVDIDIFAKDDNNDIALIYCQTDKSNFNDLVDLFCGIQDFQDETDIYPEKVIFIATDVDHEGLNSAEFLNWSNAFSLYLIQLSIISKSSTMIEPTFRLLSGPEGTLMNIVGTDVSFYTKMNKDFD